MAVKKPELEEMEVEQEQVVGSKPPARKRLDAVDKIMWALG